MSGTTSQSPSVRPVKTIDHMKQILSSDNLVVLEFMAPWNAPSKDMEEPYEEVASNTEFHHMQCFKANFDKFQKFFEKLQVEVLPLFLVIQRRKVIGLFVAINKEELTGKIRDVLDSHTKQEPRKHQVALGISSKGGRRVAAARPAAASAAKLEAGYCGEPTNSRQEHAAVCGAR